MLLILFLDEGRIKNRSSVSAEIKPLAANSSTMLRPALGSEDYPSPLRSRSSSDDFGHDFFQVNLLAIINSDVIVWQ